MKHFYLIILFVAASCSGQVNTDLTQDKKNQHVASEDSIPKIVRTLGVASGNLKCELQDRNGHIWFSSFNRGGVWRYDGKILTHFLPSADYYLLHEDERSNAYAPSDIRYIHSPDYITDDMIPSMTEDKSGNIWFATRRHGICRYDGELFTSLGENEAFVSYGVTTILEDKKGVVWLGTDKGGVFSYDGKTFKNYTTTDGLVNNSIRSILEDKDGNLWFGTRWFGLSRFDGKSFATFSEYKEE